MKLVLNMLQCFFLFWCKTHKETITFVKKTICKIFHYIVEKSWNQISLNVSNYILNLVDSFSSLRWAGLQRAVEGPATRTWEGWDPLRWEWDDKSFLKFCHKKCFRCVFPTSIFVLFSFATFWLTFHMLTCSMLRPRKSAQKS